MKRNGGNRGEAAQSVDGDAEAPRAQLLDPDRPRLAHLPALDGLRGLSVLAVVVFHLDEDWLSGGFLGVSVFFTLSGFLITRLLLNEADTTGTISLRNFFDRRFRRLLPAASVTIIGTAIWVLVAGRRSLLAAGDIRASALWHFNWHELSRDIAYGAADASALAHYWSLAIEEQFYFVYPLLMLVGFRLLRPSALRISIFIGTVISIGLAVWIDSYYNTFSRLFEILVGCAVAAVASRPVRTWTRALLTLGAVATLVATMIVVDLPLGGELPTVAIFITAAATCTIILIASPDDRSPILDHPVLRTLGVYSYSIYLWHWPVFVLVDSLLWRLVLTAVLSVASYQLVEQPLRRVRSAR